MRRALALLPLLWAAPSLAAIDDMTRMDIKTCVLAGQAQDSRLVWRVDAMSRTVSIDPAGIPRDSPLFACLEKARAERMDRARPMRESDWLKVAVVAAGSIFVVETAVHFIRRRQGLS